MFTWDSALRVSGCRFARVAASSGSGCLPCPSAPLQSITAVASRRLPVPGPADGVVRGARSPSTRVACCASGTGPVTRRWRRRLTERGGEQARHAARLDRVARGGCRSQPAREPKPVVRLSSRPKARDRRTSSPRTARFRRRSDGDARASRRRPPPKRCAAPQSPSGSARSPSPPKRVGPSSRRSEGRLTSTTHRSGSPPQDTQQDDDDTFLGVRLPSAKSVRVVLLCRLASPTPSVLRVSHPLDGLLPPGPRGFVSRHFRPWDFGLQSFSHSVSRDTSRCPGLSCRSVSTPSHERAPRLSPTRSRLDFLESGANARIVQPRRCAHDISRIASEASHQYDATSGRDVLRGVSAQRRRRLLSARSRPSRSWLGPA
jgi:hypothetical protein